MKNSFIALFFLGCSVYGQESPKAAVEKFFVAFHAKDTSALRSLMHKTATLHSVSERKDGPKLSHETVADLLKSIGGIPAGMKFEEKLLSFHEQIDGNMAHVWTPYEFFLDGKRSHAGVNSFHLVREGGQWRVVHLLDTRRK